MGFHGIYITPKHERSLISTTGFLWLECHEWEVRHESGGYFRSLYSQQLNPAALYFPIQALDLDLPWLLFQCRWFQPSVSAKALDTSHWRCETLSILYIFHICIKFKLCGNLWHWASYHSWSVGEISACGQECLEVEMETIFLPIKLLINGKKFASSWTTCITPPKAWSTVLLSKF